MASLRDRLLSKELPSIEYPIEVSDPSDLLHKAAQAQAKLAELTRKGTKRGSDAFKRAERAAKRAEKALDGCYVKVRFRALSAHDYDALIDAHPPTAAQKAEEEEGDTVWNEDTFRPALIALCAEDEMSEQDWAEVLGRMSKGERRALWVTVLNLNEFNRQPNLAAVGKGLSGIQR